MNPCPCGNQGHPQKLCSCSVEQVNRYRGKISGPLLDRIDIIVDVPILSPNELQNFNTGESSEQIATRVYQARELQIKRQGKLNYELNNEEIETLSLLETNAQNLLQQIITKQGLSARGYYRLLKLARTIADLEQAQNTTIMHISLANQYKRNL
jgi:magnesium chelatase family protein